MPQRVFGKRLLIGARDIERTRVEDAGPAPTLAERQALFAVERVALTANNVTYAAMGERMGYWRFFPAPEDWGTLPVWGFGECIASEAKGVSKGDRFYGYWPMAEQLMVETADVGGRGFSDPSEHRQGLSPVYNRYNRRSGEETAEGDAIEALFRPLFTTGWLVTRTLEGASDYGAKQVVFSSASSKTAIGGAWAFARRTRDRPELIGLTSPANKAYTESLGLYDRVLAYDDLARIDAERATVYVDYAGSIPLRRRVHEHFGSRLNRSVAVGLTHWEDFDAGDDVPPPEAKLFFAPDAIEQVQARLGSSGYAKANDEAWTAFAADARGMIEIETISGVDAAQRAYADLASGKIGGAKSVIVEL